MSSKKNLQEIWKFIQDNHVLSATAVCLEEMWSVNLFYASDHHNDCVWVMTDENTQHGKLMCRNSNISGTISSQEANIHLLKGIQFSGTIELTRDGDEYKNGLKRYQKRFPVAHLRKKTLWKLSFTKIKFTNNTLGFGTKLGWEKETVHG